MDDLISRQEVLEGLERIAKAKAKSDAQKSLMGRIMFFVERLPSVSTEKTDSYKQGWHDAIATALKETHSVHTEEGHFHVIQEETLIGVGMAYEQVSAEKTGRWEWVQYDSNPNIGNWHCSECNRIVCGAITKANPVYTYKYCPECGAKMGTQME